MISKHPLQTKLWGEFRTKTGVKVVSVNNLILTIHPIPRTNYTIGYLPKGPNITKDMLDKLWNVGKKENCIFIQIEPNIEKNNIKYNFKNLYKSAHPLFTNYTFLLNLTKSEEELLKNMHSKTRYNIRLAEKKGVKVTEDNSNEAFKEYLRLTKETTTRQNFYAHNDTYRKLMWETLKSKNDEGLSIHLFKATFQGKTLVTWMLFVLGDTLYYPYGASSSENKEVMASNLIMWEVIKFGKKLGLKKFDMWGAMGPNPDKNDPWYGFHRFKEGYGPRHVEFVGSFDFVINKNLYFFYKLADKLRWTLLRLK
jgi:lipid II:glycine glycyltransferase (peptidoglycan interpeptide bridge formation enzyme)